MRIGWGTFGIGCAVLVGLVLIFCWTILNTRGKVLSAKEDLAKIDSTLEIAFEEEVQLGAKKFEASVALYCKQFETYREDFGMQLTTFRDRVKSERDLAAARAKALDESI